MLYVLILVIFYIPSVFNYYENLQGYLTTRDVLIFLLSFAVFKTCSMRVWKQKILSSIFVLMSSHALIHNIVVDFIEIDIGISIFSIVGFIAVAITLFGMMSIKYKNLPNDVIEKGCFYELIGKPRTDLQFLLFILSGGRGGSYAITDGTDYIYMSKTNGKSVRVALEEKHLVNKKCIFIGDDLPSNRRTFNKKENKRFYLWRNCYWLVWGFKRP